jgi:biopolymer transport protein ExbD
MMTPHLPHEGLNSGPRLMSEINVTPFIDVMLVLLIIFMVTAPLMMAGVPLKLPKASAATLSPPHKPVVVSLDKEGKLFVGDDPASLETLPARLAAMVKDDPELVVYVRADKSIDYGRVVELFAKIGGSGVSRLSLLAEPGGA